MNVANITSPVSFMPLTPLCRMRALPMRFANYASGMGLPQQLRQLGDVGGEALRFVGISSLAAARRPTSGSSASLKEIKIGSAGTPPKLSVS